eukprot:gene35872-43512_t
MTLLTEQDRLYLCLSGFPVVVKEDGFHDIAEQVSEEAHKFYIEHPDCFPRALVGQGQNARLAPERGDRRCWLTPSVCQDHKLTALSALVKRVLSWCKELKQPLQLNGEFSVQLACYPGDNTGYTRHKDAATDASQNNDSAAPRLAGQRKLTWLCYLNPHCEGGDLRVFHAQGHLDIRPTLGKVVVMRSDEVEHEVLACRTQRMAVTVWAYGTSSVSLPAQISASPTGGDLMLLIKGLARETPPPPLPLPNLQPLLQPEPSILVGIANYRDSEGIRTILDLFLTATHPHRVFVGVVFQGDLGRDRHMFDPTYYPLPSDLPANSPVRHLHSNVRFLALPWQQAKGPGYARALCGSLWQGEAFFLQIDAHTRMRKNWDAHLVSLLAEVAEHEGLAEERVVLTTYPLPYSLPNEIPADTKPTVLYPRSFGEEGMLRQSARRLSAVPRASYLRSPLWAAGFSFSLARVMVCPHRGVTYSPHLPQLFFGEESLLAARLFTRGVRFFAPGETVCYHLYPRAHRPAPLSAPAAASSSASMQEVEKARSVSIVQAMLMGTNCGEVDEVWWNLNVPYGLGQENSLQEFEHYSGVSFRDKQIIRTEKDWVRFVCSTNPLMAVEHDACDTGNDVEDVSVEEPGLDEQREELKSLLLSVSRHGITAVSQESSLGNLMSTLHKYL